MQIKVRKFRPKDAEQCCMIAIENWVKALSRTYNKDVVWHYVRNYTPSKFIDHSMSGWYIVVEKGNKICGFLSLKFLKGNKVEIMRMFVKYELRGKGLGTEMIKYIESKLPKNVKKIIVRSAELNETIKFYEKSGFRKVNVGKTKINGNVINDIVMEKILKRE